MHLSSPVPTRHLEQCKQDLDVFGYCFIRDAIDSDLLPLVRKRLVEQAAGERQAGCAWMDGGGANQRVWMLVNKGKEFRQLLKHATVNTLMKYVLGKGYLVSSLTANIAGPGGDPMGLHPDQGYVKMYTELPLVANVAWMLDDFTDENGATQIIPRSHLWKSTEPPIDPTIPAVGRAGTAMVFDGRLWHGTGQNCTKNQYRRAIFQYCCRGYIRQQENFSLGIAQELLETETEEFLGRLGFRVWAGLGRIEDPKHKGILNRPDEPVCELASDGTSKQSK